MGVLVDIVPNHVGIARPWENAWWWHVLTHGRESSYADAFDIDWDAGGGRVLVPVVGDDDLGDDGRIAHLRAARRRAPLPRPAVPARARNGRPGGRRRRRRARPPALRARSRGGGRQRAQLPPLLLGQHPRRDPGRGPGVVRALPRGDRTLVRRGPRRRPPHRPPRRAARPRSATSTTWPRSPATPTCSSRRSSSRASGCPTSWRTAGTTGYDALALIDRVLTDPAGEAPLGALEDRLRGAPVDWPAMIHDTKRGVADTTLRAETRRIARDVSPLRGASHRPRTSRTPWPSCWPAPRSTAPTCPRAATTSTPRSRPRAAPARPRRRPGRASRRSSATARPTPPDASSRPAAWSWPRASRTRRSTAGRGSPRSTRSAATRRSSRSTPPTSTTAMAERQAEWPHAMTAASTHDTKRARTSGPGSPSWPRSPTSGQRALDRLLRARARCPTPASATCCGRRSSASGPTTRRSGRGSTRTPRRRCARPATAPRGPRPTRATRRPSTRRSTPPSTTNGSRPCSTRCCSSVTDAGRSNALAAKLIGLTSPASRTSTRAPSCWEQSLVDPDNRRPVDFEERTRLVAEDRPGHPKLLLVREALRLRRDRPELFSSYAAVAGHRRGGRPRAGLRPRRRGHRRHPAAARPGPPRRLGRHHPGAARRPLARPAERRGRHQRRQRRGGRRAGRAPGRAAGRAARAARSTADSSTSGRRGPSGSGWSSTATGAGSSRWSAAPATGGDRRASCRRERSAPTATTPTSSTTTQTPSPTPAPGARTGRRPRAVAHVRRRRAPLDRRRVAGPTARGRDDLRAARRHVHPRGHARRRDRAGSTT